MGRFSVVGLVMSAAVFGRSELVAAGGAHAGPAVRVVAPGGANGPAMELDDLPPPQLEVENHPAQVDVPAIPAFEASAAGRAASAPNRLEIDLDIDARPALRRFVDDTTLDASLAHLNACIRANAARRHEAAIPSCRVATDVWPDNHLAWYAWASAHLARQEWSAAKTAVERAVALRPDRAMYQLYHGIALYEVEHRRVRDVAALQLDAARDALATAVKLEHGLWRAHYYLGRIHRDLGDARRAAQQFSETIRLHPGYRFAYIALTELYRARGHVDQALAVAMLGATHVAAAEAADLWFEVGMAYEARPAGDRMLDRAIDAYGRALAIQPGGALARLRRGQLYLHRGELAAAERDLHEVLRSSDPRVASARQLVTGLLAQIAGH
jgi:tetratricopeptide (TPR) repeat protein